MHPQEDDTELIDVPLDEFGGVEETKPEVAATSKVELFIQWAVVFAIFVFLFWLLGFRLKFFNTPIAYTVGWVCPYSPRF